MVGVICVRLAAVRVAPSPCPWAGDTEGSTLELGLQKRLVLPRCCPLPSVLLLTLCSGSASLDVTPPCPAEPIFSARPAPLQPDSLGSAPWLCSAERLFLAVCIAFKRNLKSPEIPGVCLCALT